MTRFNADALAAAHTQRELDQIEGGNMQKMHIAPTPAADARDAMRQELHEMRDALAMIQRKRGNLAALAAAMTRHIFELRRELGE